MLKTSAEIRAQSTKGMRIHNEPNGCNMYMHRAELSRATAEQREKKQLQNGDKRKRQLSDSAFCGWLPSVVSHVRALSVHRCSAVVAAAAAAVQLSFCLSLSLYSLYIICNYAAHSVHMLVCWCQCHDNVQQQQKSSRTTVV